MQKIKVVKASERVAVMVKAERVVGVKPIERVRSWVDETRREIQLKREA